MTVTEAVKELRRATGLSQQVLATQLGMTTKTLQFYEGGRTPGTKQLLALAARADALPDEPLTDQLYKTFMDTLLRELEPPPGWELYIEFKRSLPKGGKKK